MTARRALCAWLFSASCGTGVDEGVVEEPQAPTRWELGFDDELALEGALVEHYCTGDTPVTWRVSDGHLAVSAACIPPEDAAKDKVQLASMIRIEGSDFGYGWLVARMKPADDDSWGVVWGPKRAYYRFRARNDTNRGAITLIAEPGADFAGRLHPDAPDTHRHVVLSSMADLSLPYDRWTDVAVHRSPERTTVYLEREPVAWFVGDPGTTGPIGFYALRMEELSIDHVAVYEPGPPPWERLGPATPGAASNQ